MQKRAADLLGDFEQSWVLCSCHIGRPMSDLEMKLQEDTALLLTLATSVQNIDVVHKPLANTLGYRWEVQLIAPPQYLGTLYLDAIESSQPASIHRDILKAKFNAVLENHQARVSA